MMMLTGKEVKTVLGSDKMGQYTISSGRGKLEVQTEGNVFVLSPARNTLFPRRAILRVGMLLRDSEIAKEIRTQLLNVEENADEGIATLEIDKEAKLYENLGRAWASYDLKKVMEAQKELEAYKNRHVTDMEERIAELEKLAKEQEQQVKEQEERISKYERVSSDEEDPRKATTTLVRAVSRESGSPVGVVWSLMYKTFEKDYNVRPQAGVGSKISRLKDEDVGIANHLLLKWLEDYGVSYEDVLTVNGKLKSFELYIDKKQSKV